MQQVQHPSGLSPQAVPLHFSSSYTHTHTHTFESLLTVARLQVTVDYGYHGLLVEIVHPACDLHGPVDQDVWRDAPSGQHPVQCPASGVLHDQAQVRLLQAHSLQFDNVGMLQHGEKLGLLFNTAGGGGYVLVRVLPSRLHGNLLIVPCAPVNFAKSPHANDLL